MNVKAYLCICLAAGVLGGCQTAPPPLSPLPLQFRFLLTFDDGPSIRRHKNPTVAILEQLADNDIQPGIKGVFFVQTRNRNGGGTPAGRALLRRIDAEGHVIGLHSGHPRGHVGHMKLTAEQLAQTLVDGKDDIRAITGREPDLVRPPYFAYNAQTLSVYQANGFAMLLTDVNAQDGVIHVYNRSPRRVRHLHGRLRVIHARAARGELPQIDDAIPIVVTFHDPNPFTASRFREYLQILVDGAARAGLPLAAKPFYDNADALSRTALQRAVAPATTQLASSETEASELFDGAY